MHAGPWRLSAVLAAVCGLALVSPGSAPARVLGAASHTSVPIWVHITAHPTNPTNSTTAKFGWQATGNVAHRLCSRDSRPLIPCGAQPVTYTRLTSGRHTFRVEVVYPSGIWRQATFSWVIDTSKPTAPSVTGGSTAWQRGSVAVVANGGTDTGSGVAGYRWRRSASGGSTWSVAVKGATAAITAEGTSIVQFETVDRAGNTSAWAPASPTAGSTVRLDQNAPSAPTVVGGSNLWQTVASVDVAASGSTDALSGVSGYQYRVSANHGVSWSPAATGSDAVISSDGTSVVQFRSLDVAGNVSPWAPASPTVASTVMLDRLPPTDPSGAGGSLQWTSGASVTVTEAGSTDPNGSGIVATEYRASTDGGLTWSGSSPGDNVTVGVEGETLVEFRTTDSAGNISDWGPQGGAAGATIRIDRTDPAPPTVSITPPSWQSAASIAVVAGGATDALAGVASYEFRTSTDGGTTWGAPVAGGVANISVEGQTAVQFRAVDGAGNRSDWAPVVTGTADTVSIDRTPPTVPIVSGGSAVWQNSAAGSVSAGGSTDLLSGLDHYESRTSTDGGLSWSAPTPGATVLVNSEGETLVEFRAVDSAGNPSPWSPLSPAGTIRLDQTGPSDPSVSGGSSSWQDPAFVTITGSGSADPMSGIDHYLYRTSTDGGITWSAAIGGSTATISSEGQTLVQFQAVDAAGNTSNWAPAAPSAGSTVRLDQTSPTAPTVTGGSLAWQSAASGTISASGSTDLLSGQDHYEYRTSTNGGVTWSPPTPGGSALITAEGQTVVQFRGVDLAGNVSNWAPAVPDVTDTVRIDRTAPGNPVVTGGSGAWQNVAGVTGTGGGASDPLSGVSHYELRTSTDGGVTWSPAITGTTFTANSEGETLVQYRAVDVAGNAASWWPVAGTGAATARIDRTAPSAPTVSGGDTARQSVASVTVTATGSTDAPGSGVSSYQYRTSTDGGITWGPITTGAAITVTAEGQTIVQFRSLDVAGFTSAWTPSVGTLAGTVRIDRTAPSAPTATGGSLTWQNVAGVTVTGGGSVDTGGSALAGYLYRTSTDGGTTWSPSSAGSSVAVNSEGQTLVQFAALDGAGNQSAWAPVNAVAGSTARIDRTPPTDPSAAGGSLSWQSLASVVVTPSGATDSPGSGVASYQYRTSVNGGTTWTAPLSGASLSVSAQGETLVQFRATDAAGFHSNWAPSALTAGATVRLDRSAPSAPTVTGGALTWQNVASLTVTGAGSTDTGGSGLFGYQVRTSTDNGVTWSAAAAGPSATASNEGQTLAQVRSIDVAGNVSAWTPAVAGVSNTMRIDRTAPSDPTVAGGSASWRNAASVTITGSGSTDSPGSGVASYQFHTSTDGGTTWSGASAGASAVVSAQTTTIVQFRAVDAAGFQSNWAPAIAGAANTVMLDRVTPSAPTITGGSPSWQNVASVTVSAAGSTDLLSGLSGYEYRASTDGGATWSAATAGSSATVSAEGQTLVQFHSVDSAGNVSAWTPTAGGAGNTVRIDRTAPTDPTAAGGSLTWRNATSGSVTGSGSTDSPGSGISHYEYRTSTDGGATWGTPVTGGTASIVAEGETDVQFRAVDAAGLSSNWVPGSLTAAATVRLDRTAPTAPTAGGGSLSWQNVASVTLSGSGQSDALSGVASVAYRTSTDNGVTWSAAVGAPSVTWSNEGQDLVQFRATDVAGNVSAWAPVAATAGSTARIDRTAPTDPTSLTGGSLSWRSVASVVVTGSGSTDSPGSGIAHYESRTSNDGGATWSTPASGTTATINGEGETDVQFRAVDNAGLTSNWFPTVPTAGSTVRIDRTAPSLPTVAGGSLSWQNVASVTLSASASTDALSGVASYQFRTSIDNGATWTAGSTGAADTVGAEGQTLVQYRALDTAGNASAWGPVSSGAANTVRIDRSPPTAPAIGGGSLSWLSAASSTVTAAGSTDAGSGVASYEYRTSTDAGVTWSAPTAGAAATVVAEGQTLVQFAAIDNMGFTSSWSPGVSTAGSTVRLDRTAPTAPAVSGGSLAWSSAASLTLTPSSSSDSGGSGLSTYQYRTSTDGGTTWTTATAANSAVINAEGSTLVQFRSTDVAGNASAWAPSSSGAANTVKLDRTAPSLPTLAGGSLTWANVASVTVSASASVDAGSGLASYDSRTSADGGATWTAPVSGASVTVNADGQTLVQFRSADALGNSSAWAPASATAASTVRIDRTAPIAPSLTGGSSAWQSIASVTVNGAGSTDTGGSGVASYQYRSSTDGGVTWGGPTAGASVTASSEGETLVQMRALDTVGNASGWSPASANAGSTIRIDRTAPSTPTTGGGSLAWQSVASVTLSSSGAADSLAGVTGYQHRTSTDGGATWGTPQAGATDTVSVEGATDVQFRAVDGAGNTSGWDPGSVTGAGTARIDRTAPSDPTVSGGSGAWLSAASATVTGSGSTDGLAGGVSYRYRTSTDGGVTWSAATPGPSLTVIAEGQTLVQFQAVDGARNASNWAPSPSTASSIVRLDRTAPALPTVTGGSLAWQNVASIGITAGGSTDALSGLSGYQYRTSTDGGSTWSTPAAGASAPVLTEGETLVQFAATDVAGNTSAWAPASPGAGSTARIDRTAPTDPSVGGGAASWQSVASVTVSGGGSTDSGSGIAGYQYRTSADGGSTWSASAPGGSVAIAAEGATLVQFRSVDMGGTTSNWAPASPGPGNTVMLDRTAPTAPTASGGSSAWQSVASVTVSGGGSADALSGLTAYQVRTSTDGGTTWSSPASGSSFTASAEGQTLVQFRSLDAVGNASAWAPASSGPTNTVRLDRTVPTAPTVTGGSVSWQNVATVAITGSGATDALSGVAGYQYRESADGGATWGAPQAGATDTVSAEGQTLLQMRSVDAAGNTSAWAPSSPVAASTVKIDRTPPTLPAVTGGSSGWQNVASVTITGSGSTDSPGSGVASYQVRSSTDGGVTWSAASTGGSVTVSAAGQTLVQFRAVDNSGLASNWAPAAAGSANTVRIDRTAPTAPTVSGGSISWQNAASVQITGSGSTDALSGVVAYQYRESTDGGTTWGSAQPGGTDLVTAEGQTLVQLRSVDGAGNVSTWAPPTGSAANTAKLDRTAPTVPTAAGGSLSWRSAASTTVTGSGATDSPGSGIASYQYRTSNNGGVTWSAATTGASVTISAQGETIVQFRATDNSGLQSAWAPATATAGSTVRLDRTLPTAPAVSGGSLTWLNAASATVVAGGSTDPGGSSLAGYQYRVSTNGGSTWTTATPGATDTVSSEGQALVQYRSIDGAGNVSAWTPSSSGASNTVRLDRTAPTLATVTGGSLSCAHKRTITGSATDTASGVNHYEYRISTDNGVTWGAQVTGASVTLTTPGNYLVQVRAYDNVGLVAAWAPAGAGAGDTACIV